MDEAAERRKSARGDVIAGTAFLALAAILALDLYRNDAIRTGEFGRDPGPGLMPVVLVALLGAGALALAAMGLVRLLRAAGAARPDGGPSPLRALGFPALMVATLGLYVWAMAPFGYVETTICFAALWTVLLGWQDEGPPTPGRAALYLVQAAAVTAAVWLVFAELIRVPLP